MVDPVADDVFEIGFIPTASETEAGIIQIATQVETDAGSDDTKAITPLKLNDREASESLTGIIAIADQAAVDLGTDNTLAVSPQGLDGRDATESLTGLSAIADQTEVDAGTNDTKFVTPLKLEQKASGLLATAEGTSTITGLISGREYLVNVYGYITCRGNDPATDLGIQVRNGTSVGSGTLLNETGSELINWPDGEAPTAVGFVLTTTGTSINGTCDGQAAEYMSAVQLD